MTASKVEVNRGQFRRGRAKTGGRRRGTPNRATRAWKEFVTQLVNDSDLEQVLVDAIRARPELPLKVAEHPVGRPRQALEVNQGELRYIQWPGNEDIAEKEVNHRYGSVPPIQGGSPECATRADSSTEPLTLHEEQEWSGAFVRASTPRLPAASA